MLSFGPTLHFPCKVFLCHWLCLLPQSQILWRSSRAPSTPAAPASAGPASSAKWLSGTPAHAASTTLPASLALESKSGVGIPYLASLPFLGLEKGLDLMHFIWSVLSHYFYSGTATNDVTCEECPPGTFSDQSSSTDICKPHTK